MTTEKRNRINELNDEIDRLKAEKAKATIMADKLKIIRQIEPLMEDLKKLVC